MPSQPEPFWNRLRDIALYPFRGAALSSLVAYALASLLGFLPGIGWLVSAVVWLAAYRYAFEVLVRTANGTMDAPEFATHTDTGVVTRFAFLLLLFAIATILAFALAGVAIGVTVLLLVSLFMPGATMSLAIDGSLPRALNPATPLAIMSRIGGPYLAVFGLLFVIQASAATAGGLLAQFMPALLAELVLNAASLWGLFATFHLMGYLVYQYHDVLGFEPERSGLPALRTRDSELMEKVGGNVADGDVDAALARIEQEMAERAVPLDTHALYRRLLRTRRDDARLLKHAAPYLNLLLLERKDREALALMREALVLDPAFTPHQSEDGHRLATRARDLGQSQLAIDIWLAMLKRWPRDPARAEWVLAVAPLLAQRDRLPLARSLLESTAGETGDAEAKSRLGAALAALPAV
ncbi:MAG: DUF4013 domain-containing protein [Xanthomonadales bacterium]|nr:DUF4013 domain-containing protein [Xanthomonadales bacterium]